MLAINFIDNPDNLPVVDHIDNNPFNNSLDNLQWVTTKENVNKEYDRFPPLMNFIKCKLYKGEKLIGAFESIKECCRYAVKNLGLSFTSLYKYRKYNDYVIKV